MFPSDIISQIANYLPYNDYLSLICTCSDYYNNESIHLRRINEIILSHSDPIQLLILSISINDIKMIKALIKLSNDENNNFNHDKFGTGILSPIFEDSNFFILLATKSNYETFNIIVNTFPLNLYIPQSLKSASEYKYMSSYHWGYLLNIIENDRDDIMSYILNSNDSGNWGSYVYLKSNEKSALKIMALFLKDNNYSKYLPNMYDAIMSELGNNNFIKIKVIIKNYSHISSILPKLLIYNNIKLQKVIFEAVGY